MLFNSAGGAFLINLIDCSVLHPFISSSLTLFIVSVIRLTILSSIVNSQRDVIVTILIFDLINIIHLGSLIYFKLYFSHFFIFHSLKQL